MYDENYFLKGEAYSKRSILLKRTLTAIKKVNGKKILDVGCGMGYLVNYLNNNGYDAWGVDSAPILKKISVAPERLVIADCTKLPFSDNQFDIVVSSDFLEHIAESEIDKYVDEMGRVGKKVLARISFRPDKEYHLTVEPKEWWKRKLGKRVILIT